MYTYLLRHMSKRRRVFLRSPPVLCMENHAARYRFLRNLLVRTLISTAQARSKSSFFCPISKRILSRGFAERVLRFIFAVPFRGNGSDSTEFGRVLYGRCE